MSVKLWRYSLPSIKSEGWAIVVIGSDGYFSTVSDFGNYSYWWSHHETDDFRKFLLRCDWDYVRRKLNPAVVYDGDQTLLNVKDHILQHRRQRDSTREEAREEWDTLDLYNNLTSEHDFQEWMGATCFDAPYEFARHVPDPQVMAFVGRVMPRLKQAIIEELEKETAQSSEVQS